MGFTKAGTSIDKQWVVCISRRFSNCKGCGLCVNACPKGLLALSKTRLNQKGHAPVELTEPDKCVGCAFCATMCPDCVITVEK